MYEIPAAPFPLAFDPAYAALVVIDMQRDFLEPGGFGESLGNDLAPVRAIVPTVAALIGLFRAPVAGEIVIDKPGKGMFYATEIGDILRARHIKQLVFAGVTTEVCVQTSMREANDRGYECLLIEDATASYFPQFKAAALEMIRAQGAIVGWTAPFAEFEKAVA
jgi:nicotinamidase-related amidase